MKRPTKLVCGILATMMLVGGCGPSDKKEQSWEEHNATRHYRAGVPRTNGLMWYMIGRSFATGGFAPIASRGSFSSPMMSRASGTVSIGKISVPAGAVRGGSFSGGMSAGS